ncbi:hypothetical protein MKX01_033530 [Papaver californicum]|nr:hypothetical protein MKX01_033530 [Papaver californicum]
MNARKGSPRWVEGVQSFIQFTIDSLGEGVKDPCMKCKNYNSLPKSLDDVHGDILDHGFDVTYRTWIHHEKKPCVNTVESRILPVNNVVNHETAYLPKIHDLFNETLGRAVGLNNPEECLNDVDQESDVVVDDGSSGNVQDSSGISYSKRLTDAVQPLYPGCGDEHTKLSTTVELFSMHARYQCFDVFMTELFGYLKSILPEGNTLPSNCSKAKNMIKLFQLPVQIIHACINDCIFYHKDYANEDECPKCGEGRWVKPPEGSSPTAKKRFR